MNSERLNWICTTLEVEGGERVAGSPMQLVPMGMAAKKKLWEKGKVLKVRFIEGTAPLHDRVMQAAQSWFLDDVNLKLAQAQSGEAGDIRISFDASRGSWSYVGTDCRSIHPTEATMNLGWATLDTPDKDFSSVVIHEFGHALGLLHEHNHPEARIEWDEAAVRADLGGPPNYWNNETIDSNVFAKFAASDVITTDFDNASVMIYTIPAGWTINKKSCTPSWKLSAGDAATIRKLYAYADA